MIPHDIETDEALSLLSRRRFLQAVGATGVGLAATNFGALAAHADPIAATDTVLVVLTLAGGNDGLNTVVPTGNGKYFDSRRSLAIPAAKAIDIGDGFGLHPSLPYLKSLYTARQVAIVQGVGVDYRAASLSHFDSMATWMRGHVGGGIFSGWLGRWLDAANGSPILGTAIGPNVPLSMTGTTRAAAAVSPYGMNFGANERYPDQARVYNAVRNLASAGSGLGQWGDAIVRVQVEALEVAKDASPLFGQALPGAGVVREMAIAARLINADIGVRIVHVIDGGYDTHGAQLGTHANLLAGFDAGLKAFFAELAPAFKARTAVLVVSEFGRSPADNDSRGTDHGSANSVFMIGQPVTGGLYGSVPSFTDLDPAKRLKATVDFRSVYATVLDRFLGGDSSELLSGTFETFPFLTGTPPKVTHPPVTTPPGTPPSPPPLPNLAGRLIAINPERRLDTREAVNHARKPFQGGVAEDIQIAGLGSVPSSGVASVLLNLTVTNPTQAGWVTVWPTGEPRPDASNLNFSRGQTVPNLVLCKLGNKNSVSMYLNAGTADLVADVVGYYATGGGNSLVPMTPARLLDTRSTAPIGPKGTAKLKVVGVAGLPATGVMAVALNVTVTQPTAPGWMTVYPSGEPRPNASNLNFVKGQTVPNLVVVKVGSDGNVAFYNENGKAHVLADIVAWFSAGEGAAAVAVQPVRLLDTRKSGRVGANAKIDVVVAGVAGVPANAIAVSLNVTADQASQTSYVTVWPSGQTRPIASNLNMTIGQTVPNQVIAAIGDNRSVSLYNAFGNVHLIADLVGYYI
jgi:uncharacterized protein (DUF1501 family)